MLIVMTLWFASKELEEKMLMSYGKLQSKDALLIGLVERYLDFVALSVSFKKSLLHQGWLAKERCHYYKNSILEELSVAQWLTNTTAAFHLKKEARSGLFSWLLYSLWICSSLRKIIVEVHDFESTS